MGALLRSSSNDKGPSQDRDSCKKKNTKYYQHNPGLYNTYLNHFTGIQINSMEC